VIGHVEQSDLDPNTDAVGSSLLPKTPEERLEASRAALRIWLAEHYRRDASGQPEVSAVPGDNEPEWLTALFDAMSDRPLAAVALRWAKRWWANHPWRQLLGLSGQVLHESVAPVARRHPWLLLLGAALAGVALSRLRPWRWISGGALLTGLLPQFSIASVLESITQALNALHADPRDEEEKSPAQQEATPPEATASADAPIPAQAAGDAQTPPTVH
jgi:hypothetical protein